MIAEGDIKAMFNSMALTLSVGSKKQTVIESTIIAKPSEMKRQEVENHNITSESVFNAFLGEHFAEVEEKVGRFSLIWPLGNGLKLATIGRSHALFFEQEKLVGYQFSEALLPIGLRNRIELANFQGIILLDEAAQLTMDQALSESQATQLRKKFQNITLHKVADAYTQEQSLKIKSLALGRVKFDTFNNVLGCINLAKDLHTIASSAQPLIEFVNSDNRRSYLSGCRQLITMTKALRMHKLELLDPWSSDNAELYHVNQLFSGFAPWQFMGVRQGASVQELGALGEVFVDFDEAEFEHKSGDWHGKFYIENDKLAAATLTSTQL